MMFYWTDLHLERDTEDDRIATAIATVLDVPADAVAVVHIDEQGAAQWDRPGLEAFVQRDDADRTGEEFPVTLMITLRRADGMRDQIGKVRSLGAKLGIAFITDVETEGDAWRLVMPDGEDRMIRTDPDASGSGKLMLSPGDRAVLEQHRPVAA